MSNVSIAYRAANPERTFAKRVVEEDIEDMVQPPPIVGAVRAVADPVPPVAALRPEGCHRSTPGCDDDFARESLAIAPTVVDARAPRAPNHRLDTTAVAIEQGAGPVTEPRWSPSRRCNTPCNCPRGVLRLPVAVAGKHELAPRPPRASRGHVRGFAPPPFGRPFDPAFRYVRVGVRGSGAIEREVPGMPEGGRDGRGFHSSFPPPRRSPKRSSPRRDRTCGRETCRPRSCCRSSPTGGGAGSPGEPTERTTTIAT